MNIMYRTCVWLILSLMAPMGESENQSVTLFSSKQDGYYLETLAKGKVDSRPLGSVSVYGFNQTHLFVVGPALGSKGKLLQFRAFRLTDLEMTLDVEIKSQPIGWLQGALDQIIYLESGVCIFASRKIGKQGLYSYLNVVDLSTGQTQEFEIPMSKGSPLLDSEQGHILVFSRSLDRLMQFDGASGQFQVFKPKYGHKTSTHVPTHVLAFKSVGLIQLNQEGVIGSTLGLYNRGNGLSHYSKSEMGRSKFSGSSNSGQTNYLFINDGNSPPIRSFLTQSLTDGAMIDEVILPFTSRSVIPITGMGRLMFHDLDNRRLAAYNSKAHTFDTITELNDGYLNIVAVME